MIENKVLYCPECAAAISNAEIKNYLSAEEIKEIEKTQLDSFIGKTSNMVKCACGYVMEAAQGQVDYNAKDEAGQVMSPAAAIHMSKFRMRCRSCEKIFCHGCTVSPYHAGKNCDEYAHHLNAKKCRFCGNELVNQGEEEKKGDEAGAFDDICLRQECQDMIRENCVKQHACGHPCRGFFGEEECLPCLNNECVTRAREEAKAAGNPDDKRLLLEDTDEDSYCTICYVSGLGSEPCIKLGCRHVFHVNCIKQLIDKKWSSPRIVFAFMNCPSCKQPMQLDHCAPIRLELEAVR